MGGEREIQEREQLILPLMAKINLRKKKIKEES